MKNNKFDYPDLHDHIESLKVRGLLQVIDRPIDKVSELHPLVRFQFVEGMDEAERKAFLFTNIVNAKRRRYEFPVLVGGLAANREIYSVGMGCAVGDIQDKWDKATNDPIKPKFVQQPECQEVIHKGRPGLSFRLMIALTKLKHIFRLGLQGLCIEPSHRQVCCAGRLGPLA